MKTFSRLKERGGGRLGFVDWSREDGGRGVVDWRRQEGGGGWGVGRLKFCIWKERGEGGCWKVWLCRLKEREGGRGFVEIE